MATPTSPGETQARQGVGIDPPGFYTGHRSRPCAARMCIVLGGWLATTTAAAEPAQKTAVLSWVRAPGAEACASLAEVAARVNARLGRSAFVAPTDAKLLIEASIVNEPEARRFRVHIVLASDTREPLGTRDLEVPGDDCREATDTAALAIALMIDPNAGSVDSTALFPVEPDANRAPSSAPPPPAVPAPAACPPSVPQRPPEPERWRTRVGIGALSSVGQLPGVAFGALGSVRLSPRSGLAGVEVSARYLAPKNQDVRPGVGGTFSASSVGLAGFWAPAQESGWVFSLAGGAELGTVAANGYNFAQTNQYRRTWLANAELAPELSFQVARRFALLLRLGLKLPLVREEFDANVGARPVRIFKASAVMGDLALGLAFDP